MTKQKDPKPKGYDKTLYVAKRRKGKWVLTDRSVYLWQKFRKKPIERDDKVRKLGRPKRPKVAKTVKDHDFFS